MTTTNFLKLYKSFQLFFSLFRFGMINCAVATKPIQVNDEIFIDYGPQSYKYFLEKNIKVCKVINPFRF